MQEREGWTEEDVARLRSKWNILSSRREGKRGRRGERWRRRGERRGRGIWETKLGKKRRRGRIKKSVAQGHHSSWGKPGPRTTHQDASVRH